MLKIAYFQHFFDDFQHFFNFFFDIFFSTFFAFLRSPGTKQNFIFLVKSHFPSRFCLQRGKCNIQKMQHFQDFLHVTFSPKVENRYGKWLFTKKIKFCLVPGDLKNSKKVEINMLNKKLKKCWKSSKKCWK